MLRETWNVVQLGLSMCLVFFAFSTQGMIVETVLADRRTEDPSIPANAGYYSQTIVFGFSIFSLIIAPPIVTFLTPKWSLFFASTAYTLYLAGYWFLNPYNLFASSAFEGFWAGMLWTALPEYITLNSTEKNIQRNRSIAWMIYTSSFIFGGLFLLFTFGNSSTEFISKSTMLSLYSVFTGVSFLGNIVFLFLQPKSNVAFGTLSFKEYALELRTSWKLLWTPDLLLLVPLFAYTGIELSFWSTAYSTALSFTKQFTMNTNQLMALYSIAVGVGELLAGTLSALFGNRLNRFGHTYILLLGTIVAIISYILAFINLPGKASYEKTDDTSLIQPNVALALIVGVMLGFMDSVVNTQIYSYVGVRYHGRTTQAFALHKFFSSILATSGMFYSSVLGLHWQLLILVIGVTISMVCFAIAERRYRNVPICTK